MLHDISPPNGPLMIETDSTKDVSTVGILLVLGRYTTCPVFVEEMLQEMVQDMVRETVPPRDSNSDARRI